MKKILPIYLVALAVWSLYRVLFVFPESVDEFAVKPILFVLLPFIVYKKAAIFGLTNKKTLFEDLLLGISGGIVLGVIALAVNALKYGKFNFDPVFDLETAGILFYILLSLVTSYAEEVFGRGFLFAALRKRGGVLVGALYSSLMMLLLHIPLFVLNNFSLGALQIVFLVSVFMLSMVNAYIYESRKNLVIPTLLHAFWNMAVGLYV